MLCETSKQLLRSAIATPSRSTHATGRLCGRASPPMQPLTTGISTRLTDILRSRRGSAARWHPLSSTQHLIGNVLVTLAGDAADSVCYLQAQHVRPGTDGGDMFIIAGRYLDRFVRTPDGWQIAQRRFETFWTEGNPAVTAR